MLANRNKRKKHFSQSPQPFTYVHLGLNVQTNASPHIYKHSSVNTHFDISS